MFDAALSADALFSFLLAFAVFLITVFSVIHELQGKLGSTESGNWLISRSEKGRSWLLRGIERGYQLRYVSAFVLGAIFVASISPVKALIEIEDRMVSQSCLSLQSEKMLVGSITLIECAAAAKTSGISSVKATFGETQNHLLQIAVWPLILALYGFVLEGFFRLCRKAEDEPIADIIERAPHVFHLVQAILIGMAITGGFIQNALGS